MSSKKERLIEAKVLDLGLMTQEQFNQLQQQILSEMGVQNTGGSGMSLPPNPSSNPKPFQNTHRLGSYVLSHSIGEGGQGSVYIGRHDLPAKSEEQGGDVAIRLLHVTDEAFLGRLQREATTGLRLQHPNITKVFDLVKEGDKVGIVMEYIDGKTLYDFQQQYKRSFTWNEVKNLMHQVFGGLAYAHSKGVVHRDIVNNIMVSKTIR